MNVALLGGSFNPPHVGHLMIAQQVLDFTDTDEVWFLPNYGQSPPKEVASVEDRLAMANMLVLPKTTVSTIEIDHKLNGETITLLPYLPKEHSYTFVIGSDQLPTFNQWADWEKLLAAMPFFVFPRYGYANEPLYTNMSVVSHESLISSTISSTKIRARVKAGRSISLFVSPGVEEYITSHGLYT